MRVLQWDWKSEPDWQRLNKELKGWEGSIVFTRVDTDSDSYAVVVSHASLTTDEANTVYKNWTKS